MLTTHRNIPCITCSGKSDRKARDAAFGDHRDVSFMGLDYGDAEGGVYVAEAATGRVSVLRGSRRDTAVDGLAKPQGIAIRGGTLYIVDSELKELIAVNLADGQRQTLASGLPVGTPSGVEVEPLGGVGELAGPMISFTGLAVDGGGALYIAADAEGSVLCLRPDSQ